MNILSMIDGLGLTEAAPFTWPSPLAIEIGGRLPSIFRDKRSPGECVGQAAMRNLHTAQVRAPTGQGPFYFAP